MPLAGDDYKWLDERLHQLSDDVSNGHLRLRNDMQAGFDKMSDRFTKQEEGARKVADRLLVLETQRESERSASTRHGAVIGGASGIIGAGIVGAILRHFKW